MEQNQDGTGIGRNINKMEQEQDGKEMEENRNRKKQRIG